ncbi:MAG TPA: DUF4177 domain-containing protein [Candidatus Humimicrobiaceae bacterium]|nr:DUF4177 domain-containing protein [Candidatus Humimicrobiaceae bacterium]
MKWGYKIIRSEEIDFQVDLDKEKLEKFLNQLGKKGWELISIRGGTTNEPVVEYMFKKQKG